jgi:ribosomal protein S18 acetylase RimI-like enzyme
METTLHVRESTPADVDGMTAAAGRAFGDDALNEWLLGGTQAKRERQIAAYSKLLMRIAWSPDKGRMFTADGTPGVAMWFSPGNWKTPTSKMLRAAPRILRIFGPRAFVRAMKLLPIIEKKHPHEEHWYLQLLATDPPMQRRGVASSLLQPILEQCDAEGLPAYLETQKLENVAFYRHFGFDVREEIEVVKGGPHMWLMWREPR